MVNFLNKRLMKHIEKKCYAMGSWQVRRVQECLDMYLKTKTNKEI